MPELTFPTADDYVRAVQDAHHNFTDPALKAAVFPAHPLLGVPMPASGSSAVVFKAVIDGEEQAMRFFTRHEVSTRHHYEAMNHHFDHHDIAAHMATSTWLDDAITVNGKAWPAVRMQWVNGRTLDAYVADLIDDGDTQTLTNLATAWCEMVGKIQDTGFAHGDLQHGNILVDDTGTLRLVDFDCAWLPELDTSSTPSESGHRNYQRADVPWGRWMDTFPAYVVHTSLLAVSKTPALWPQFHDGENLLFSSADFVPPYTSKLWTRLQGETDPHLLIALERLRQCCARDWKPSAPMNSLLQPHWWEQARTVARSHEAAAQAPTGPSTALPPPKPKKSTSRAANTTTFYSNGPASYWYKATGNAASSKRSHEPCKPPMYSQAPASNVRPAALTSGRRRRVVITLLLTLITAGLAWQFGKVQIELLDASYRGANTFGPDFATRDAPSRVLLSPSTGGAGTSVSGDMEGLYQGTLKQEACDRSQLASYLASNGQIRQAWTAPLSDDDIFRGASDITDYVMHLTPMLLRADTRVTAYHFDAGEADAFQASLEAGTAVLVDHVGIPRVRCIDASPLTSSSGGLVHVGSEWPGFSGAREVAVVSAPVEIPQFSLVDVDGGQQFRRPYATAGEADFLQIPSTAALVGRYDASGDIIRCENTDCASRNSISATATGCPTACSISGNDWNGTVPLTFDGNKWQASGTSSNLGICNGWDSKGSADITYAATATSAAVIDGIWTAQDIDVEYTRHQTWWQYCDDTYESWTLHGHRVG